MADIANSMAPFSSYEVMSRVRWGLDQCYDDGQDWNWFGYVKGREGYVIR